jgi:hypothetical protein
MQNHKSKFKKSYSPAENQQICPEINDGEVTTSPYAA